MSKIDTLYKEKSCRRQLFLNFLITVTFPPGYFSFLWYVVSLKRRRIPWQGNAPTERGTSAIRDPRVVQIFENSGKLHLGEVKAEHNDRSFRIYDKERMLVELLRHKNQFPFEYYKEILLNYRQMIHGLDIPRIYDYICALPKSKMVKNAFRLEVL